MKEYVNLQWNLSCINYLLLHNKLLQDLSALNNKHLSSQPVDHKSNCGIVGSSELRSLIEQSYLKVLLGEDLLPTRSLAGLSSSQTTEFLVSVPVVIDQKPFAAHRHKDPFKGPLTTEQLSSLSASKQARTQTKASLLSSTLENDILPLLPFLFIRSKLVGPVHS